MKLTDKHFADRLVEAIKAKQTPLVVGLDPRYDRIPFVDAKQPTPALFEQATAFTKYCIEVIEVVADFVPAVKPQAAFFEQLGPAGMIALGNVISFARKKNLLVILDAKRGDIGSTAEAYAQAYLDWSERAAWGCDALTVNPYLGDDSLTPFVDAATANGAGIFVLTKTSNPGSQTFQELKTPEKPLFEVVGEHIQSLAKNTIGQSDYGSVGAVIGATHPEQLSELREKMPNTFFLIPGFGAQGGTAADIAGGFDEHGLGAVVNSSRNIIFAHQRPEYESCQNWKDAVAMATRDAIEQIASETSAGKLKVPKVIKPQAIPHVHSHDGTCDH